MTETDDMFGYLPVQASAGGGELRQLAEAMEEAGHYGPAFRMFEWALDFIEGGSENEAYGRTVKRRDACRDFAARCGDDVSIAFQAPNDEILDDVRRFAREYYNRQANALCERLDRLMERHKWSALVDAADAAQKSVRFAMGSARKEADYRCASCSGAALVKLERYDEAVERLGRAHGLAGQRGATEDAARCAYHYGVALFHTRAEGAGAVLAEAAAALAAARADDDDHADCLCLLAEFHARRLAAPREQALAAAAAVLDVVQPKGDEAAARFEKTAARARACIEADTLLKQAVACRQRREIDEATAALDDAEQQARAAGGAAFAELIDAERGELSLCDPGLVAQHGATVREMLRTGKFADADELYGKLHDRQGDNAAVAAVGETIARTKRAEVDRQVDRADDLVRAGQADEADALLTAARELARSVDYVPAALAQTQGRLSHLEAKQMGAEAKRLSEAGDYAAALALAKKARALPNLADVTMAKIGKMIEDLSSGRDRAAMQCRQRLKTLVQEGRWDQARGMLAEAESKGTDGQSQVERKKIEGYFRASDLLERAEELLGKSKTVAAGAAIEEVFQATSVSALLERANDIASRVAKLDKTIAEHYVDQDKSRRYLLVSALVGVPLGGAMGWLGDGFFHAIWTAAMLTAAIWGGCLCVVGQTIPTHDGRVHGLSMLGTGLLAAMLSYLLPWWACVPVAVGLYTGAECALNTMCPAQKPGRDPGGPDRADDT